MGSIPIAGILLLVSAKVATFLRLPMISSGIETPDSGL